jgi:long-chain acyl-CoA synthetase
VDGWLRTGDLGSQGPDGTLYLHGRLKDLIIRGGYNIHPGEVERVLLQHPAISAVAVAGRPHPTLGEEVHAFVVLAPGQSASPEDLHAFAGQRLAAYKVPREFTTMDELPTNHLGKVVKSRLP